MTDTIYTVNAKDLLAEAAYIESCAEQSLKAWIILGQTDKYSAAMKKARAVRGAAAEKSVWIRREILRNAGYTIKSARSLSAA